ncbi:MAG TPA: TIGR00300 family protein [Planctomycetota bacterium]|nr:TIGR00300 family protein [Planctomycetota bacterium]
MPSESIELSGHIVDSGTLQRVLDQIIAAGADYVVEEFRLGHNKNDESFARVRIDTKDGGKLQEVLELVTRTGATLPRGVGVKLEKAPKDGVLPDDFYATTNLPTDILINGNWVAVSNTEMDCAIVVTTGPLPLPPPSRGGETKGARAARHPSPATRHPSPVSARCLRMHRVKKGDLVVVGHAGIRVEPPAKLTRERQFEFMASSVSSEKPKHLAIREIARQMKATRKAGEKILFVGGPAIVHTAAGNHLQVLIEKGFVDVLFAGNALAAHDIESNMFGTSLGVSLKSGTAVEHGHEHHLRAINRVRAAGSIAKAVKKKILRDGIMYACVRKKVPFVLSGSIRDDGPLPDVITDMPKAQDAMRAHLPGVGLALMVGTTLLSIATGNMLSASVKTICVDINPAVVTKLSDRGTFHAIGLVTDAELFLRTLTRELGI